MYWTSPIWIWIYHYLYGSGSFHYQTKIIRKTLISTVLWLLYDFLSLKNRVNVPLKGHCHEIFDFWFFSWIRFPQAPEYTFTAISNFLENSRTYSQLKIHHRCHWHRWQMKKILNQKNFNNLVGTPLDCRVNIYINFCLQVHFKASAAWCCSHCLPPMSTTLVANCHRYRYQQH